MITHSSSQVVECKIKYQYLETTATIERDIMPILILLTMLLFIQNFFAMELSYHKRDYFFSIPDELLRIHIFPYVLNPAIFKKFIAHKTWRQQEPTLSQKEFLRTYRFLRTVCQKFKKNVPDFNVVLHQFLSGHIDKGYLQSLSIYVANGGDLNTSRKIGRNGFLCVYDNLLITAVRRATQDYMQFKKNTPNVYNTARYQKRLRIVQFLLDNGADVNASVGLWADKGDQTPLHFAAKGRDSELLRLLLAKKPRLTKDMGGHTSGKTPVEYARLKDNKKIIQILKNYEKKLAGAGKKDDSFTQQYSSKRWSC